MDVLTYLLVTPSSHEPIAGLDEWVTRLACCPHERPIDQAVWSGFESDRLGYAFVGGYRAALERLLALARRSEATAALRPLTSCVSLAATESGGAHPRAIETTLRWVGDRFVVEGQKTFATLASIARELLVVASSGQRADGTNDLRVVRISADAPGVRIEDLTPTPFAPEIPHARVTLSEVPVDDDNVLPGDGYQVYLKPFRTIEDVHVLGATLGFILRIARDSGWSQTTSEHGIALVAAIQEIAGHDPSDPVTHLALSGIFRATRQFLVDHEAEWARVDPVLRERWQRDVGLLSIAEGARRKRTEAAWKALASRT